MSVYLTKPLLPFCTGSVYCIGIYKALSIPLVRPKVLSWVWYGCIIYIAFHTSGEVIKYSDLHRVPGHPSDVGQVIIYAPFLPNKKLTR